ncbi:hypothetical protein PRZ48_012063 [Zasmidium cellare]|uniref:Cytochrome P450 n=1 Tax=Zasmidium cellare TaxID=395010 RepID=A0ABR0E3U9_ZASCE|nr:hypothetical protein PRZ48_012063 [Zasmidium cellare]
MEWSYISLSIILLSICLTYLLGEAVYNIYFHPLASFPGPRITAVTKLYGMYFDMIQGDHGGRWSRRIYELHQQYGPIVRIEPNEVHILDSSFYHNLYNFDPDLEKKDSHIPNLQHTASTAAHRVRRKAFDPYFSRASIQKIEPLITSTIDKLSNQISNTKGVVDLSFWFRCMTFEIICTFMLSQPYNLLDDPEKSSKMIKAIVSVFKVLKPIQQIPAVSYIMNNLEHLPKWMQKVPSDEGLSYVKVWEDGLMPRLQKVREGKAEAEDGRVILMQEYLKNETLPQEEKSYANVKQAVLMMVGAGMETTGYALSMATYQLHKRPNLLRQAKEEISTVWPASQEEIPSWSTLEKLPLLTAILKESMRLSLGVAARLIRVNRKQPIQYKTWSIPPGCHVSMNQSFVLYDPEIFVEPREFEPERWLKSKDLDRWFVPFSRGGRGCIGERLAWAEMYLTLAAVLHRFDMELYKTEDVDVYPVYDHFVPFPERENGVRVTVREASRER